MSVIPFRSRSDRAEIDDLIDRALQDAGDGERWTNPPRPVPTTTIYLLPRRSRLAQRCAAQHCLERSTMRSLRPAYREMRHSGVEPAYARHAVIAAGLVEWTVR